MSPGNTLNYDLVVVGAGSGGFGAAMAAARLGLRVLLLEAGGQLGGTAVIAGVSHWEPGAGGTGLPYDVYERLCARDNAVAIYRPGRHFSWDGPDAFPGGEAVIDPDGRYANTLQRCGAPPFGQAEEFARKNWAGVVFEPDEYESVLREMLDETGMVDVRLNCRFAGLSMRDNRVEWLRLADGALAQARVYVDATGGVHLCRACGATVVSGQESKRAYDEPSAPETANEVVNAATLVFRVVPTTSKGVEPLPEDVPAEPWQQGGFPAVAAVQAPRGGYIINMLPTMQGREVLERGREDAYVESLRRLRATWHHIQQRFPEFRRYRIDWIAPRLGVREDYRVAAEYILTENDVRAGLSRQQQDDLIAVADHAVDRHGDSHLGSELEEPYGVPFRCLQPVGLDNVLAACRGAGFSSIAASSCRLSRTMMQLGQAAGTAAALAKQRRFPIRETPPGELREALREQHVCLEWPMPAELLEHLRL